MIMIELEKMELSFCKDAPPDRCDPVASLGRGAGAWLPAA